MSRFLFFNTHILSLFYNYSLFINKKFGSSLDFHYFRIGESIF